jgi:hypothetical protein
MNFTQQRRARFGWRRPLTPMRYITRYTHRPQYFVRISGGGYGGQVYLGCFRTVEEARAARDAYLQERGRAASSPD